VTIDVVILAAGQGSRMRSKLPKVLHHVGGKSMVQHVIDKSKQLEAENIHVVIGHGGDKVKAAIDDPSLNWITQQQQLGTGHAVSQALPFITENSTVLIAYGDVPLVAEQTLSTLVAASNENTLALLTVHLDDPTGYGRVVRKNSQISAIVEQKDASIEQQKITEVNTGILAVPAQKLKQWLPQLSVDNAQGEYYLTDIIAMAVNDGMQVQAEYPQTVLEVQGVNNRQQLAVLERVYQQDYAERLMLAGATLADPNRIDVRGELTVAQDVFIDVNCVFKGEVSIAEDVIIGPNCMIENATIGAGTIIKANTIIESAQVGKACDIGPFARLRPGTVLADKAKIGNFVETKKAIIGEGSKVNHLSYIGDTEIGEGANVGAGTITCNYDGANKFKTYIGDGAFIGSNTALVAPVKVGKNATIGAGSTISMDVADEQLGIVRAKQKNISGWKRPVKK
jgi:bifunctional UDP-N-acetylglucosamine pyrophosphorylase/glucosamine-1-phosphate N-acetyltransferase